MKPTDLRGILRYVPQFREKTFVVAVDGAIVADDNFGNILMDVAVLWSLNIRTVLVHGAAAQIQALAEEKVADASDLEGSGVTDADTLELALTAANRVTHEILEGLRAADLRGASTNAVIAHPLGILRGVDHLFTGRVERIDVELLQTLLANGIVPVVPPLGLDGDGHTYRVNSDAVALEVAKALGAVKLVYVTTADGLLVGGTLARQIAVEELEEALEKNPVAPAQASKARHAVAACRAGVPRVHVINGRVDEGLLAEVFSNEGIGTLVYANEYRQIRRARKRDVRSIAAAHPGLGGERGAPAALARGHRGAARRLLHLEVDRNPVACVALHVYPEREQGRAGLPVRTAPPTRTRASGAAWSSSWRTAHGSWGSTLSSPSRPRPSTSSSRRPDSPRARPRICPPRAARSTSESRRRSKVLVKRLKPAPSAPAAG